jgi:tetratricopeptide (TPR) repeat protein
MNRTILLCCATLVSACATHAPAVEPATEDPAALQALVDDAAAQQQLPAALAVLAPRRDPTALWFQGRVRYLLAEVERGQGRTDEAFAELDAAIACFTTSMQQNPAYGDASETWLARCLGKKGNLAFVTGDLPHAEQWLLEATRLRPERIGDDLGGGETTKLGLLRLGDRIMRDFARTEALFRAAATLAPHDVDLLNNAAVYARDHGTRLERAGRTAEATAMYERSYATYQAAVRLEPTSVRLRNDCALIAIHHLECDWEAARQMLDAAIADGERTLRDAPPADAQQHQDLDEAVGDCWENLALWHLKHGADASAAKTAATASLAHFPQQRRAGAQRHLEAAARLLDGK